MGIVTKVKFRKNSLYKDTNAGYFVREVNTRNYKCLLIKYVTGEVRVTLYLKVGENNFKVVCPVVRGKDIRLATKTLVLSYREILKAQS